MHFSLSLITAAIAGFSTVLALPAPATNSNQFTNCPLNGVSLPDQWLIDTSAAATNLVKPTAGQRLGKLVVGVGSQNYSCVDGKPVANGAIAVLYDLSCAASANLDYANTITAAVFQASPDSLARGIRIFSTMMGAGLTVGTHFFKGDFATPVFEFRDGKKFVGQVNGKIPALAGSIVGKDEWKFGAVPSLRLIERTGMGSNYQAVYRMQTAGGTASPTCNWTGQKQVPYAAQYWMFGSS